MCTAYTKGKYLFILVTALLPVSVLLVSGRAQELDDLRVVKSARSRAVTSVASEIAAPFPAGSLQLIEYAPGLLDRQPGACQHR